MLCAAWPGRNILDKINNAENTLRTALTNAVRKKTNGRAFPALPSDFDASRFVTDKVRPMVCGLFPARERQAILDLFKKSLVFVSRDNIDLLITETKRLSTVWDIANIYLGSLGLPGLNDQPVGIVGFSEETTFFVSITYFEDSNPFTDWVVHEAAHVFHNWKRASVGLPHTRTREFLLEIAYSKREVFAYACEAYARILERAKRPDDRRRLCAEYAEKWMPDEDRFERKELVNILASAVAARNGWKRILGHCAHPGIIEHAILQNI